jgi:hypothetical protein
LVKAGIFACFANFFLVASRFHGNNSSMSWFNWFSNSKKAPSAVRALRAEGAGRQQAGKTASGPGLQTIAHPASSGLPAAAQRLEQRRTERNAKRELLFQVVRESMVRVGVLSSAYKFKVLSLDQRGRSFLVMVELAAEFAGEVEKLNEIENMISQTARRRYEILVQAVYWRYFSASVAPTTGPAPLFDLEGAAAADSASPAATNARVQNATSRPSTAQDDLSDEEIAAFRRALYAATDKSAAAPSMPPQNAAPHRPVAARPVPTPLAPSPAKSNLLLTGYEDTEMVDDEPIPALSGTQYGDLR